MEPNAVSTASTVAAVPTACPSMLCNVYPSTLGHCVWGKHLSTTMRPLLVVVLVVVVLLVVLLVVVVVVLFSFTFINVIPILSKG